MSDQPHRILIIEDSPEDREVYRRSLGQGHPGDYLFWETGLGEEGLRLCREVKPDCVLLDYQLPDLNGLEFLERFSTAVGGATVPIIMLTGHGNEAVAVQAMKRGIHDYIVKGLNNAGLRQVVQSAIDQGRLRRQLQHQQEELARLSAERLSLIAELKQQTAALAESNQRKDDFLAMLAHELRNPLAPLRTMLQVMLLRGIQDPAIAEARAIMDRQVTHMTRLVDDLLDVSRITRGRIELRKALVDVAALARNAVEASRPFLETRHHEVTVALPSAPLFAEADSVRLEQILGNLLNNAAKYTDPGGHIGLTAVQESMEVVVCVQDSGMGISQDLLPRVFDLFTQGSRSLDRSQGGLGIGLTLVKRLVEMHGGTVQAFSDGPGQGSKFVVRLPASVPPPSAGFAKSGEAMPALRPLRVLVVDDNTDAAESLAILLTLKGHWVRTAFDGHTALQAAEEESPDVVLLDIGLPGIDGYEVARRIRAKASLRKALLIALTGYCQEHDRQNSSAAGFHHHLVKPVDLVELQKLLADLKERPVV